MRFINIHWLRLSFTKAENSMIEINNTVDLHWNNQYNNQFISIFHWAEHNLLFPIWFLFSIHRFTLSFQLSTLISISINYHIDQPPVSAKLNLPTSIIMSSSFPQHSPLPAALNSSKNKEVHKKLRQCPQHIIPRDQASVQPPLLPPI